MTNTTKMPWLKTDRADSKAENDKITDQSLTIKECRTLLEVISYVEPSSGGWNTEYKTRLRGLKQKAVRGAAMETPSETRERHNIEEYEEEAQTVDELFSWWEELDEQHERKLEEDYEAYEETEIERQHEEAEIERQIEETEIERQIEEQEEIEIERQIEETEIERQIEEQEEIEIERQIEQEQEQEQYRVGKRWEDFSIAEIEKEYKQKNKGNRS